MFWKSNEWWETILAVTLSFVKIDPSEKKIDFCCVSTKISKLFVCIPLLSLFRLPA